jgi:hypothetical protein
VDKIGRKFLRHGRGASQQGMMGEVHWFSELEVPNLRWNKDVGVLEVVCRQQEMN